MIFNNFLDSATDTYTTPPPTPAPTLPPSLKQLIADTVKLNPWVSSLALTPKPLSKQELRDGLLYTLYWGGKGLKQLPESIGGLHLAGLDLSNNKLTGLPADVDKLLLIDIPDGGAEHYARVVRRVKVRSSTLSIHGKLQAY